MKKLSYVMCGLAMIGMMFTGCKKDQEQGNKDLDNVIEDGFYCVGAATAVESINASNLNLALMGAGTNEATKQKRAGMYEKYVYLLADKEFQLVLHKEGKTDVIYGADLKDTLAISDNDQIEVRQYKGLLAENLKMKVPVEGLYHIILDLNEVGDLTSMGGAMIAVVPCNWGFRGDMNDWGFTEMKQTEASTTKVVFEYVPEGGRVTYDKAGAFKFAHSHCWKFNLDMAGQVKAENNIGTDAAEDGGAYTELLAGGKNIPYKRGIYDKITLTWELKGGAMAKSFTFNMNMCEKLPAADPATFKVGVSGGSLKNQDGTAVASWADPEGCALAVFNQAASSVKDQETLAGTYVYNVTDLYIDGEFKLRYNGAWLGAGNSEVTLVGVSNTGTDNFVVATGAYNIKMTVEWDGEKMVSMKAEFSKGKDPEIIDIDPTQYVYSFIGTVNGNWDTDTDLQLISNSTDHLVYQAEVTLAAGEFKIRRDHEWNRNFGFADMAIEGAEVSNNEGNVVLAADYNGIATFEFDWNGSTEENVKLTFGNVR